MLADVQTQFGSAKPFQRAGNFETEHQRTLVREVYTVVQTGRLVVVAGLVGSGKRHLLTRIEEELGLSNRIAVARSLAVDKRRTSLPSLIEQGRNTFLVLQAAFRRATSCSRLVQPSQTIAGMAHAPLGHCARRAAQGSAHLARTDPSRRQQHDRRAKPHPGLAPRRTPRAPLARQSKA